MARLAAIAISLFGADDPARSELLALAQQLVDASSYSFTQKAIVNGTDEAAESDDPDEPARARGGAPRDVWTVRFERGRPIHYTRGFAEFHRLGHRYVALAKDDTWMPIELPPRIDGEPPSRERLRGLERKAFEIDRMPLPHELFADVESLVESVERAEKDGTIELTATLAKKAARDFLTANRGGRTGSARKRDLPVDATDESAGADAAEPGQAEPAPAPLLTGTLHVIAEKRGEKTRLVRFEIDVLSRTATGERTLRREYVMTDVGATTVHTPDPASKLLGGS